MARFIARILISALGLWIATRLVPGIEADTWRTLLLAALLLGIANAIVRPVLVILTLPITIVTLGLFLLIINGFMLELVAFFLHGFHVHGLVAAVLGSIVVGLTGWIGSTFIGPRGTGAALRR
jgi:putative membrane protein